MIPAGSQTHALMDPWGMAQRRSGQQNGGAEKKPNGGATTGHEADLWAMADALRGSMATMVSKHVPLGLIFLKYISDAFEERHAAALAEFAADAAEDRDEYTTENIYWVLPDARWVRLRAQLRQPTIDLGVDQLMAAIKRDSSALNDALPRDYARAPRAKCQRSPERASFWTGRRPQHVGGI